MTLYASTARGLLWRLDGRLPCTLCVRCVGRGRCGGAGACTGSADCTVFATGQQGTLCYPASRCFGHVTTPLFGKGGSPVDWPARKSEGSCSMHHATSNRQPAAAQVSQLQRQVATLQGERTSLTVDLAACQRELQAAQAQLDATQVGRAGGRCRQRHMPHACVRARRDGDGTRSTHGAVLRKGQAPGLLEQSISGAWACTYRCLYCWEGLS